MGVVTSVYVAASDAASGKSVVALGLMESLTGRLGGAGVFRPVVRAGERDPVVELLRGRYPVPGTYQDCVGVTYDDVHKDPEGALATIVERYHALARRCEAVVVVGTDYTDVGAPTEFAFNARIAVNLASPILLVVNGLGRTGHQVASAAELARTELTAAHATVLGVIANRVPPEEVPVARQELAGLTAVPAYALPEMPRLTAPTVGELMRACDGELLLGEEDQLGREASGVLVAAMTLPNVLDHLTEGAAVITPGDRVAILIGLLAAHRSGAFPALSAIVMSGGFAPSQQTRRLVEGLAPRLPVILTHQDTYATASALATTRGRITANATAKIADALGVFERNVNTRTLMDRLEVTRSTAVTPVMFEYELAERARAGRSRIVLPEGGDERILRAADVLIRRNVADLTLLGDPAAIKAQAAELGLDLAKADVIDPSDEKLRERFAEEYARLRAHKGVGIQLARDIVTDVSYFGTMMVHLGIADGMVSGAAHTTAHTIRPSFEIIKTEPGTSVVSSVFFMCLADRVLVYGDCAVNPDPDAERLADIAISSAATAARFGVEPRIAMLSYSTGDSGSGSDVVKVREATALVRERTELPVEGPIQYDAAVDAGVAHTKLPDSQVAGRATVFIVPDLNTGNNVYKAVQRSAGAVAVGPVLQGLRKPVNDLSRGATVQDIVNTVAITAVQAQSRERDA